MAKAIPDRWTAYKSCGAVIEGTSFICFKVPLRKAVQQHRKEIQEIWDIETLLAKIPGLGAVIDLTNTARYYDPTALESVGVLHKKILIPGREIPPESKVNEFKNAVEKFLNYKPGMIIGVHCTHGLNRTGYMVCRYMRDQMGISGEDAIDKFETARGYHIERKNYIADVLGETPLSPDRGPHNQPVRPVKVKHRPSRKRIARVPGHKSGVAESKNNVGLSWRKRSTEDNTDTGFQSSGHHRQTKDTMDLSWRKRSTEVNADTGYQSFGHHRQTKDTIAMSRRKRSPEDDTDSEFQNSGRHRPRESADGKRNTAGGGSRKMYGRPSAHSSKYSFDYRYDY